MHIETVLALVQGVVIYKQEARESIDRSGRNEFKMNVGADEIRFLALEAILKELISLGKRLDKIEEKLEKR